MSRRAFTPYHGSPACQGEEEVAYTPKGSFPKPWVSTPFQLVGTGSTRGTGFTLMELLFVVIIVGILVTIALPGFARTTERAQQRQAWDMLQTIYASEQVFFSVNDRYSDSWVPPANPGDPPTLGNYMDNPNTPGGPATYSVTVPAGPSPQTFTATATGRCGGAIVTMTIDQRGRNFMSGAWLTCPMPI